MAKISTQTEPRRSKKAATPSPVDDPLPFANGDLGKIQSILFGEQSHKFELQLADMTAKFEQQISQTNSDFTARLEALEAKHKRQLAALDKDLNEKTTALDKAKLDSKAAGRILTAAAEKISKS